MSATKIIRDFHQLSIPVHFEGMFEILDQVTLQNYVRAYMETDRSHSPLYGVQSPQLCCDDYLFCVR